MADLSKIRALDCEMSVRTSNLIRGYFPAEISLGELERRLDSSAVQRVFSKKTQNEIREVIRNAKGWPEKLSRGVEISGSYEAVVAYTRKEELRNALLERLKEIKLPADVVQMLEELRDA